ncbi:MAG: GNAT family N-acetyltransferase [Candidatus Omnitrophota bacterium]
MLKNFPGKIESERLIIRSPLQGDGKEVLQALTETFKDLHAWFIWATEIPSLEEMEANIFQARAKFMACEDLRMHLYRKDTGEFVGVSGLHRIDWDVPKFEIAYWCRKKFQNQGYMTEAVKTITAFSFHTFKANRVEIRSDEKNTISRKIPEKLGFALEGKMINHSRDPHGQLRNLVVYAKTKSDS